MKSSRKPSNLRRICFVTGTRAEFGLMKSTLCAIADHPKLKLQIIATGMHLSRAHGSTINDIRREWKIDATVPWNDGNIAIATGKAIAALAGQFKKLKPDIVLVVGDRVEAFAAASAAHISGIPVAHVHGGDRALGQIDDSLRHAITKLAHIHFPATKSSADRIARLGEDRWRINNVGSPAIDDIKSLATKHTVPRPFALVVLHPTDADNEIEFTRAQQILRALRNSSINYIAIIYPNNDPGHQGILRAYHNCRLPAADCRPDFFPSVSRSEYLALLRDCEFLIGNSSSGIIEAASFNTPVIDVGPRQLGREHASNVVHVTHDQGVIERAIKGVKRRKVSNPYGGGKTSQKIARILASVKLDETLMRKLISY